MAENLFKEKQTLGLVTPLILLSLNFGVKILAATIGLQSNFTFPNNKRERIQNKIKSKKFNNKTISRLKVKKIIAFAPTYF